jgi:hypothetical protein
LSQFSHIADLNPFYQLKIANAAGVSAHVPHSTLFYQMSECLPAICLAGRGLCC